MHNCESLAYSLVNTICLKVKAQINFMWFLEEFQASEILHVIIFYTLCSYNFL
jgi:hypothetical protein